MQKKTCVFLLKQASAWDLSQLSTGKAFVAL